MHYWPLVTVWRWGGCFCPVGSLSRKGICPAGVSIQGDLIDREPPCVKTLLRAVKTKMAM